MDNLIICFDDEKNRLTEKLSEYYAGNIINIEEYERLIEYINKIETKKEIAAVENIIQGYNSNYVIETPVKKEVLPEKKYKSNENKAVFSWRTSNVEPLNGKCGKFVNIFGTNRIIIGNLPPGRTILNIETVFGMTEIVISHNVRIINKAQTVFSGVFFPEESGGEDDDVPELLIEGKLVFGNLSVIRK